MAINLVRKNNLKKKKKKNNNIKHINIGDYDKIKQIRIK